jgi:DNA-binding transcriptional LysR family regulator
MWREDFQLALPDWHPLSLKEEIEFKDLHGMAFIQRMSCEAGQALQTKLNEAGYHLDIRARIQTIEYALGLVKAGVGCALLPSYKEIAKMEDLQFRPIKDELFSRHIVLGWREDSEIVRSLLAILKNKHQSI